MPRTTINEVALKLASDNWASILPSSMVTGVLEAGLVLDPYPETMFGICRPASEINYQLAHS